MADTPSVAADPSALKAASPAIRQPAKTTDAKAAAKAARDFEAFMLGEMLEPMFAGLDKSNTIFGGGHGEEAFRGMLIHEYGRLLAERGGIGIAKTVEKQILDVQGRAADESDAQRRAAIAMRAYRRSDATTGSAAAAPQPVAATSAPIVPDVSAVTVAAPLPASPR